MSQLLPYSEIPISRTDVDAIEEAVVLDFGTNWCSHCRAAEGLVAEALGAHPGIRHLRIEDGPGRRLGRSFGVRLWPTLVFMRKGEELARVVRPASVAEIRGALAKLDTAS